MLSHYHEAAYDAHMTGVVFGHILKLKEIDNARYKSSSKDDKKGPKNYKGGQISQETKQALETLKN